MISKTSLRNVHVIFRTDLNSLWVHSLIWFKKTILLSNMHRYLQRIGALIVRKQTESTCSKQYKGPHRCITHQKLKT